MAVININYDDGNKEDLGYKSVDVSYNNLKKNKIFNSGNFVKDWFDCIKFCIIEMPNDELVSHSSSINHFIMDGAPYDSMFLMIDIETRKPYLTKMHDKMGVELFVPEGTEPTWEELKEMCK
jgi:hypothetical protein